MFWGGKRIAMGILGGWTGWGVVDVDMVRVRRMDDTILLFVVGYWSRC